jgi:hypothetical protein
MSMARAKKTVEAVATPVVVTSIKGFDKDLKCRGYQFEIGATYHHEGRVKACEGGFHACPVEHHPLSVFEFYAPAGNRFFEVSQSGETDAEGTKLASASLTINVELTIPDLVKRAWDYVWSRAKIEGEIATGYQGAASSTGDYGAASSTGTRGAASSTGTQGAASSTGTRGAASSTGYQGAASSTGTQGAASSTGTQGAASSTGTQGAASSTGDYGAASSTGTQGAASSTGTQGAASSTGTQGAASSTGDYGAASSTGTQGAASSTGTQGAASSTGDYGAASSTGTRGAASSTGTRGAASSTGYQGAAMASGYEGRVMGKDGNALFAVERGDNWTIISVAAGIVGKADIKAGVWYVCKGGQLVEAA